MDDFDLEIKNEFINEALSNLEESEGAFLELESSPDPKPLLDRIFRLAHNLKGGSRAVGFGDVAEFTHQLENLVLKIQNGGVLLSSDVVSTLLRSNDRLIEMFNGLKGDLAARFDCSDLIAEISGWLSGEAVASAPIAKSDDTPSIKPSIESENTSGSAEMDSSEIATDAAEAAPVAAIDENSQSVSTIETVEPAAEPLPPSSDDFFAPAPALASDVNANPVANPVGQIETKTVETESKPPEPKPREAKADVKGESKSSDSKSGSDDEVIRVNLSRINLLNDLVGELIVLQSVVQQQAENASPARMAAAVQQMAKLSKDIQELSMSLRMLPVKPLVQKLQRVVRDTAKALGKDVELSVVGESMEIDKSVLDRLSDPLIHILRNGVDHGIEMPDARATNGKPRAGKIVLSFENQGNHLIVEARDDGKGIDTEVLRKKATEKKLISSGQAMTERQLINLIFHPGFSTKAVTSEISGRGVGMDVVKTNIEQIGGVVEVTTTLNKGSLFKIQIPLSLSVIEGLVVLAGTGRYVIPLGQVQETVNLRAFKTFEARKGMIPCFDLRGRIVPLFGLEDALSGRTAPQQIAQKENSNSEETALIVLVDERPVGIRVKDIVRAQQIVIKPLGGGLSNQKGWIGSCVLGDGMPTIIVSPSELLSGKIRFELDGSLAGGAA